LRAKHQDQRILPINKDVIFNHTKEWANGKMSDISEEEWNSLRLFSSDDSFLLAFKDIQGW